MLACVGLFAVALVVRLIFFHLEPQIPRDTVLYLALIEGWFEGGELDSLLAVWSRMAPNTAFYIPPLFLYLGKLGMSCGMAAETAGRTVSMLSGALTPPVVYLVMREWSRDRRIRYGAAFLAVLHPGMVELSGVPLRDGLSIFLAAVLILFLSRLLLRFRLRECCAAGIVWMAAVLTRYENWEFLFFLIGILTWHIFFMDRESPRRIFTGLGCFLVSAAGALVLFGIFSGYGVKEFGHYGCRYLQKQYNYTQARWKR